MERTNARILVVDDSEQMRRGLVACLHGLGVGVVDEAPDGEVAMGKVATHRYDVVISDWQMPRMDGISLLRCIRSTPGLERLPVLIITGDVTRERIFEAADAGVNGFLSKPFFHQSLEQHLSIFLGPKASGAQAVLQ